MIEFNHHQWKLVFTAVRKAQINSITDGKEYQEYNEILDKLYPLAYSEQYERS